MKRACMMVVVLSLVMACSFAYAQEGEFGELPDKLPDKPPVPPKPEGRECALSLINGDQIRGRLDRIADGKVSFRPAVAPDTVITLGLESIGQVRFSSPDSGEVKPSPPAKKEALRLRNGSILYGKAVKLLDKGLRFEVETLGPIDFSSDFVEELRRDPDAPAPAAPASGRCVVTTNMGDLLNGNVAPAGDGLVSVRGGAVEATIQLASVSVILFPPPVAAAPEAPKKGVACTVTTADGMTLFGDEPQAVDETFSFVLAGAGQRVSLPFDRVGDLTFSGGGALSALSDILVWGRYSDRAEEFPRTVKILKDSLGRRAQIVEDVSETFDPKFRQALLRSRALVIAEMEQWNADGMKLAPELRKLAADFLARGGNIVICGPTNEHKQFLLEAGLVDIEVAGERQGASARFTDAGRKLAKDIGDSFTTTNSTQTYRIGPTLKGTVPMAELEGAYPIVARKVGAGCIIVYGMDHYESNEQTQKILINAVNYR